MSESQPNPAIEALKAKMLQKAASPQASITTVNSTHAALEAAVREATPATLSATPVEGKEAEAVEFQVYTSSLQSHKLITPKGKVLAIINKHFMTKDPEIIAWLDKEIEAGMPHIKKGNIVTSVDLDPMAALRRKIIEEYKAEQEAAAIAAQRKMEADSSQRTIGLNPMSASQVAAGPSNS